MTPNLPILARDDDSMFKLVGAVVVLIVWGISAMVGAARKGQQQALRKKLAQPAPPQTAAPRAAQSRPLPRPAAKRPPPIPARAAAPTAVPLPPLSSLAAPPTVQPVAKAKSTRAAVTTQAPSRSAVLNAPVPSQVSLSKIAALLQPKTVRAQFILAEVLQPPLALRTRHSF